MARLSYGQLEQLWIDGGGSRALAPLMAAIALAESGGDPQAENRADNNGTQTSWGLWQISDGTHNQPVAGILDPLTNAKAAVAKYRSQGLGAWGTYDSGAYQRYYQGGVPPSSLPQGGGGDGTQQAQLAAWWNPVSDVQALIGGTKAISSIPQAMVAIGHDAQVIAKTLEWLVVPSHWVRISCFGAGLFTGLPGLWMLSKAGSGDASLATGILLVTLSGMFFFLAFHNLPADVTDIGGLLGFVSEGVRGQKKSALNPAPDFGKFGTVAGNAV